MALPLRRWCNAVMAWHSNRFAHQGEEGQLRWAEFQSSITTPPAGITQRPAAIRAAVMTPEQESAAFAAFAGANGQG